MRPPASCEVPGIGPKLASRLAAARDEIDVDKVLATCREHAIQILTDADSSYPRLLTEIHDPPPVLFMQGQFRPEDALSIAIVGSRHATHYGLAQAERLAASLARAGLTIVSGLAGYRRRRPSRRTGGRRTHDRGARQRSAESLPARTLRPGRSSLGPGRPPSARLRPTARPWREPFHSATGLSAGCRWA